jgi:hypothetical protein
MRRHAYVASMARISSLRAAHCRQYMQVRMQAPIDGLEARLEAQVHCL